MRCRSSSTDSSLRGGGGGGGGGGVAAAAASGAGGRLKETDGAGGRLKERKGRRGAAVFSLMHMPWQSRDFSRILDVILGGRRPAVHLKSAEVFRDSSDRVMKRAGICRGIEDEADTED